jgi:VRR-NUC domain
MPARSMITERVFQRGVVELAKAHGWKCAHFHDSRRQVRKRDGSYETIGDKDAAGFPDLVLVREGRLIFAELKREKGRLSTRQSEWLHLLGMVEGASQLAVLVCVWRPRDWGRIEAILAP